MSTCEETTPSIPPELADANRLNTFRASFPKSKPGLLHAAAVLLANPNTQRRPYGNETHASFNTLAAHWGNLDPEKIGRFVFAAKRVIDGNYGRPVLRFMQGNSRILMERSRPNIAFDAAITDGLSITHQFAGLGRDGRPVRASEDDPFRLMVRVSTSVRNVQRVRVRGGTVAAVEPREQSLLTIYQATIPLDGDPATVAERSNIVWPETVFGDEAFELIRQAFAGTPRGIKGFDEHIATGDGLADLAPLVEPPKVVPARRWGGLPGDDLLAEFAL